MRPTAYPLLNLLPWLLALASCTTPPRPPTVDESRKRPANTAQAVELQACRGELQAARIQAAEAMLARAVGPARAPAAATPQASEPAPANGIYTVHFTHGSAQVQVPPELAAALLAEARQAPLVLLRGRTDGRADTPADSRIARERAAAMRQYLVAAGVEAGRIRSTHQPSGDMLADNRSPAGRQANRRVEVEVYRALPQPMGTTTPAQALAALAPRHPEAPHGKQR